MQLAEAIIIYAWYLLHCIWCHYQTLTIPLEILHHYSSFNLKTVASTRSLWSQGWRWLGFVGLWSLVADGEGFQRVSRSMLRSRRSTLQLQRVLGNMWLRGCYWSDPSKFVIWDGIHYTEALYKLVATTILQGKFVDLTGINFSSLCDLDFSKYNDEEELIQMSPFCQW